MTRPRRCQSSRSRAARSKKKLAKYDRYAQPGRSDPMFKRWRLYQRKESPEYLVPLHIYDADTVIIYGKARNSNTWRG